LLQTRIKLQSLLKSAEKMKKNAMSRLAWFLGKFEKIRS